MTMRDDIRHRLAGRSGRGYWRSLEELAGSDSFSSWVEEEFPGLAQAFAHGIGRRHVLRMIGASLSLTALAGCSPAEPEVEMAVPVEEPGVLPGSLRHYATATSLGGFATGVLVTHVDGRPIKIEGNPDHPASLGATSAFDQAALLQLYDPDRAAGITRAGSIATAGDAFAALRARLDARAPSHGAGIHILSGAFSSPTLLAQRDALLAAYPALRWHVHEPAGRANALRGAERAFGRAADAIPALADADVILAIDSDLLSSAPGHLAHARAFAARRATRDRMNRLYAWEATPTLTGAAADHRFVLAPGDSFTLLQKLASLIAGGSAGDAPAWLAPLARDLAGHHGGALVHVGPEQPPELHALAHVVNHALAAPVRLIAPVLAPATSDLGDLCTAIDAGEVDTLLVLGGDPLYSAPGDLGFAEAFARVPNRFHLAPYHNATAAASDWVIPQAHELESWSDARAFDGSATIQQPLLHPLHGGLSAHQLLAFLLGAVSADARAPIAAEWQRQARAAGQDAAFDSLWQQSLRTGVVTGSASAPLALAPRVTAEAIAAPATSAGMTALFRADATVWDGRFANNGWLQELPDPLTTLTWDNAALIAPADAQQHALATGDVVRLTIADRSIEAPVWVLPGQAPGTVTLPLGYGQTEGGRSAVTVGFDAYRLRTHATPWQAGGAAIAKSGQRRAFAATQHQPTMQGRDLLRTVTLTDLAAAAAWDPKHPTESLYPREASDGRAWGMAIDLTRCIGCGACTVACQAENNVPVVGREEVQRGRTMHWLRIDRYYQGDPAAPHTLFQPVLCMHCEDAPCEVVCPVGATVHDREGLNVMVYNRCVGTRFCSNNCPYKVRRFNFFDYAAEEARPAAARNPQVSVRSRGVMEKCTYCLQRIKTAEIAAGRDGRALADGEVVTACQAACPTQAIVFGDLNDQDSAVTRAKTNPLDYALLGELGTRPRTSYAARLLNPNPELGEES